MKTTLLQFRNITNAPRKSLNELRGSLFRQTIQSQEESECSWGNIWFKKSEVG